MLKEASGSMFAKRITVLFFLVCSFIGSKADDATDLIIFSYDRPMQLYALLESIKQYVTGIENTYVVYRVSDERFEQSYQFVNADFDHIVFCRQGSEPHKDFKPMTESLLLSSPHDYLLFAVDDIIVTDAIDLKSCIYALQQTGAYGFYLRLGANVTECYMCNCEQPLPPLTTISSGIYSWILREGKYDWGYPNTTDMTLYKKSDIVGIICSLPYRAPNSLEMVWSRQATLVNNRKALCFTHSKIVNVPLNLAQQEYTNNRNMKGLSTQEMLGLFEKGLKIDIAPLHKIDNKGAHMEYEFSFIAR